MCHVYSRSSPCPIYANKVKNTDSVKQLFKLTIVIKLEGESLILWEMLIVHFNPVMEFRDSSQKKCNIN